MIKRLAMTVVLTGLTFLASPALAVMSLSPFSNPSMELGQAMTNGRYTFIQQTDGNLVLYRDSTPLWASYKNGLRSVIQTDGNFVQYDAAGKAVWASNTASNDSANPRLELLENGQVQVRNAPPASFEWIKVIIPADTSIANKYPLKATDLGSKPSVPNIATPPSEYWYKLGEIVVK